MAIEFKAATADVLHAMDVVGSDMIGKLGGADGIGFKLLGILFGIMFFYKICIFMIDASQKIMVDITKLLISFTIVSVMLIGWTSPVKGVSISGFFLNTIPAIANVFTDGKDPTVEIVDLHSNAIKGLYKVISPESDNQKSVLEKMSDSIPAVSLARTIVDSVKNGGSITGAIVESALNPINTLISVVLLLIAAFFILWSLLTFVFVLNAGQVMMYVGLAIGPILIPFLLIPNLSFLFNGWLKFMISAALYKVIAVLVGLISIGAINQVVTYANVVQEDLIFMSLLVLFFAMLGKQLMGLADNMASAIATGGANSGGAGDSGSVVMMTTRTGGSVSSSSSSSSGAGNRPASLPTQASSAAPAASATRYRYPSQNYKSVGYRNL